MSPVISSAGDRPYLWRNVAAELEGITNAQLSEGLPEPLQVIAIGLRSAQAARESFPGYRLTRLVTMRQQLDGSDMALLSDLLGEDLLRSISDAPRPFDEHLRKVIARCRLQQLFNDEGPGLYHHAIRPSGYDFHRDEVIPLGMEQWRANYRAMSDERQMLAASIIWLYRAAKDNVWLRRVPCTWHAGEAIACMKGAGVLGDWARLFALYPGW